jgi:hypothetical protein
MITDTAFERGTDSDFNSSSMREMSNDRMNDFVEKYEANIESKKKPTVLKKKGLEKFMGDSE